jgi:hypothetical protein
MAVIEYFPSRPVALDTCSANAPDLSYDGLCNQLVILPLNLSHLDHA